MLNNPKELISIQGGASRKKVFRYKKNNINFIILDFSEDIDEFNNHLTIYNILKDVDISIPKIFEVSFKEKFIVTEDFGDLRFDKIINKYKISYLLESAVESLIIINNSTINSEYKKLSIYNYDMFQKEIYEFVEFFFPYKKIDETLTVEFIEIWKEYYNNLDFKFNAFVHKDFELTNLIYLPDFQNALIGFKGWDLFSLLENSRIYFSRDLNEKYIKYYFNNTYPSLDYDFFRKQYYFLNVSRQTRLLGR